MENRINLNPEDFMNSLIDHLKRTDHLVRCAESGKIDIENILGFPVPRAPISQGYIIFISADQLRQIASNTNQQNFCNSNWTMGKSTNPNYVYIKFETQPEALAWHITHSNTIPVYDFHGHFHTQRDPSAPSYHLSVTSG